MEGLHERLEAAVRTPRARHRRFARGSRHARPDVGPQKPFHAAGADCGATLSLCHGVSGLTRASCQYADTTGNSGWTIGCRLAGTAPRGPHGTRAQEGAEVRLGETETNSQNTVTTPRSVQRVGDTESRKKRNI